MTENAMQAIEVIDWNDTLKIVEQIAQVVGEQLRTNFQQISAQSRTASAKPMAVWLPNQIDGQIGRSRKCSWTNSLAMAC
ncbi:MAG: hypothetical protein HC856_10235 [Pseudanabaena sp. RU_4_16]|nr:hypothetical protein [Pseudanabaena sp. RU_4_16]